MALWEMLLCKITFGYSEMTIMAGVHLFDYALLFSVVSEFLGEMRGELIGGGKRFLNVISGVVACGLFCAVTLTFVLSAMEYIFTVYMSFYSDKNKPY
ncbi:hypothetical protein SAMN02910263_04338 [Butyrivibrio sp. INlla16]|nr:hypothetical protein SAMN02910263_04338 [Butyrivibrio sp. INlla16]